ncbi:MAG: helix-turn-helix transcriptional regulator, partial [Acidimicrobiales bacterium]
IPVRTEPLEGPDQFGYRVDADAVYLPELELSPQEQAALHLAVAGVELGDASGHDALLKLGTSGVADVQPVVALAPDDTLSSLFDAVKSHAEVTFAYRGVRRSVAPGGLRFHHGYWYLVAWDRTRDDVRTFRVDRLESRPQIGRPGTGETPEGFKAASVALEGPWRASTGDGNDVEVLVDAVSAPRVVGEVGEGAVTERRPDGSVLLRLGVVTVGTSRTWILGLLDHAEVVGPEPMRRSIVEWLGSVADAPRLPPRPEAALIDMDDRAGSSSPNASASLLANPADTRSPVRARWSRRTMDTRTRLRRLLAIVSWLGLIGEAPIATVAERFSMSEDEVVHELELAACCGVPPYTPDTLLEIIVTQDTVQATLPRALARPRRLTSVEGFALAAAARTIQAVPGADHDGALASALAKLETALGDHRGLTVDLDDPPLLQEVRRAVEDRARLAIKYYSASTDETTHRVVDPLVAISIDGHWYLDAYCHRAEGTRRFRVDRIVGLETVGTRPEGILDRSTVGSAVFVPGPGAVTVRILVGPGAMWVAEAVPVLERRTLAGGSAEITLAIGGAAWLERFLLQAGPEAQVLGPPEMTAVGPAAARRVLGRYRTHDSMK